MSQYVVTVPVRWSDQDSNGHINNAKIVTLAEEARIQWLNKDAAAEGLVSFDVPKVVVSLHVEFHRPLSADGEVQVGISVKRIGRTSFTLCYSGAQADHDRFTAETTLVVLDRTSEEPRPLTDQERSYLLRHAVDNAEKRPLAKTA